MSGVEILSSSGVQSYLERKAESISKIWQYESQTNVARIDVVSDIAIYDGANSEVILMMEDVEVKAQKPQKNVERKAKDAKRLDPTVVLIQDTEEKYHYASKGINIQGETIYSIERSIIDKICQFHSVEKPLPIVAITDGARSIRLTLQAIFGFSVCIILDWYYLQLKVKNLRDCPINIIPIPSSFIMPIAH